MSKYDEIDLKILKTYQLLGPIADKEMAHHIGRSIRPTQERIRNLLASGAVKHTVVTDNDTVRCPRCGKFK